MSTPDVEHAGATEGSRGGDPAGSIGRDGPGEHRYPGEHQDLNDHLDPSGQPDPAEHLDSDELASTEHAGTTVVRSRAEIVAARKRRQTYTFMGVFGVMMLIGFIAFGNWQQWWTIGGSSAAAAGPCPVQVVTAPELANVTVINGTTRAGLAKAVSKELRKRKFTVLGIDTEVSSKPIKAVAQVRFAPDAKLAATTVARQFPGKVQMVEDDKRSTDAVDLVIGDKYKGMVSAKQGAKAIALKPQADNCIPVTSTDPSESVSPST